MSVKKKSKWTFFEICQKKSAEKLSQNFELFERKKNFYPFLKSSLAWKTLFLLHPSFLNCDLNDDGVDKKARG